MDSKQIEEIYGPEVEIRKLTNIKVLTPDGFKQVSMIKRKKAQGYFRVKLSNSGEIQGSDSHKVLLSDGHFAYISMLSSGMELQGGIEILSEPEWVEQEAYLYDLLDVDGNIYLTTNGVTNHNCAFIDNIEETFAAAQMTLATGGQAMLLSTPNGMGNFFHKTWVKAELGENSFVPILLPWTVHPERDQAWRDRQDADLGPRLAAQECDGSFLTSGNGVFEPEDLKYYEDNFCKDPIERRGLDNNLWIWEYPDYSRSYMVSADVARGDGSDYSAFHVWDVEACAQVAEYKGQLTPRDFGATLCGIAAEYNNALLVIENANVGWSTIEEVLARGYPNLYYSTVGGGRNETAESYMRKMETGKTVAGFTTSAATRPLVISKLYDFIHQRAVILRSKRLIEEMRVFIWSKSGKAEAASGYNDDLCLSAGISLYTRDTALRNKQIGVDATRAVLGGFVDLNRRSPKAETRPAVFQNPYQIQNPYGQTEDISWVL